MTARTMYQQYAPNLFKLMAKRGKDDYNLFNLQSAKMYYFNTLYSYAVALPTWEGLDLSIKPDIMERIAIDNGSVVIHYDPILDRYVTLLLGAVHEWDVDGRPLRYDASPLYAGGKRNEKSGIMYRNLTPENSVIIYDTITQIPTITTIDFYAVRLANLRLTLDHIIRNCKVPYIIRTTSDNMAAIQGIFNEIYNFKPAIIEDGVVDLECLKAYTLTDNLPEILQRVNDEYTETFSEALKAIGVNVSEMKRERMNQLESMTSMGQTITTQDVRLKPRIYGAEQLRETFKNSPKPMNDVEVTFTRVVQPEDGTNWMDTVMDTNTGGEEDGTVHT